MEIIWRWGYCAALTNNFTGSIRLWQFYDFLLAGVAQAQNLKKERARALENSIEVEWLTG